MIADAADHHRADAVGDVREALLDRENNAVVERVAFGRAGQADGQDRAGGLDPQQLGGSGEIAINCVLCRIVMFYNEWRGLITHRRPCGRRDPIRGVLSFALTAESRGKVA